MPAHRGIGQVDHGEGDRLDRTGTGPAEHSRASARTSRRTGSFSVARVCACSSVSSGPPSNSSRRHCSSSRASAGWSRAKVSTQPAAASALGTPVPRPRRWPADRLEPADRSQPQLHQQILPGPEPVIDRAGWRTAPLADRRRGERGAAAVQEQRAGGVQCVTVVVNPGLATASY